MLYCHSYSLSAIFPYKSSSSALIALLNQARAGRRPARAWFLKITSVRMYVCATSYSWPRGRTHTHTYTHTYIRTEVILRNQARAAAGARLV